MDQLQRWIVARDGRDHLEVQVARQRLRLLWVEAVTETQHHDVNARVADDPVCVIPVATLEDHGYHLPIDTDVRLIEAVEALRDATLDAYGAVHVVCNNAGIGAGSQKPFWEQHVNDWRWSYDVNVFGVVNGINAFVPVMLDQDTEGHVVNTSSGNGGFSPLLSGSMYASTKAAVVTITECLWGSLRAIDDLSGHKVGILQAAPAGLVDNQLLLDTALAQYDVPSASVGRISLTLAELSRAVENKEIDAVLAVGVPGSDGLTEAVNTVAVAGHGQPVFLPIAEAKAIAQRSPAFEGAELMRGAFGGAQPKPAEDFVTLGVSTRAQ